MRGAGLVLLALILTGCSLVTGLHADGEGPLQSIGGSGTSISVDPHGATFGTYSWGIPLCAATDRPVTITSVKPVSTIGVGFRLAGLAARTFEPAGSNLPIGSIEGFPPPVPDSLSPAIGFLVTTQCAEPPGPVYSELIVGFDVVGTDGGGWQAIDIGYDAGGHEYILRTRQDLLICGASIADKCMPTVPSQD